jgi:formylglycine-generating enzyme required for sulfatase activity
MRLSSLYLAFLPVLSFSLLAQQPPKRLALVIGNGNYKSLQPVRAAVANADLLASQLKAVNFDTDSFHDLDRAALTSKIVQFKQKIAPGDIVFFYYSGCGMQPEEGDTYLVPVDYDPSGSGAPAARAQYLRGVLSAFDSGQAGQRVVVLDAAWACPGVDDAGVAPPSIIPDHTLIAVPNPAGMTLPMPSGDGPTLFARSLVAAMRVRGLKLSEVFSHASDAVIRESGGKQRPMKMDSATQEFYFSEPEAPKTEVKVIEKERAVQPGEVRMNGQHDQLNYAWIPPSDFEMGCVSGDTKCAKDESPQHKVTISKGFWMGTTEITITAYERFLAAMPGHAMPKLSKVTHGGAYSETPINNVSWQEAQDYCHWAGGRLPTEAEWEYAGRGGQDNQIYPFGNRVDYSLANYFPTLRAKVPSFKKKNFIETTPVSKYPKNRWDLFDMAGNVNEWVADFYDPDAYGRSGPFVDPEVKTQSKFRVVRGGSWNDKPEMLRSSARQRQEPEKPENTIGFRCAVPDLK